MYTCICFCMCVCVYIHSNCLGRHSKYIVKVLSFLIFNFNSLNVYIQKFEFNNSFMHIYLYIYLCWL